MAGESIQLTGLWPAGNRGTMWSGKMRTEDVLKARNFLDAHPEGVEITMFLNEVPEGSRKPVYSLKLGEPWRRDQAQAPAQTEYHRRDTAPGRDPDDGNDIPF